MGYKIAKFAELTGLSAHTLRYYEKEGLIKPNRNLQDYREYDDKDLQWIAFIQRLKATNMPIQQIKTYADLRSRGDSTLQERFEMLERHEKKLELEIDKMQENLQILKNKKEIYKNMIEGKVI